MLVKRGNIWHHVVKVNGRKVSRSTGMSDKRRAQARAQELEEVAQLLRESPNISLEINGAIVREVARVEADISVREASRVGQSLRNFAKWVGRITLDRITKQHLVEYQRHRLEMICPKCKKPVSGGKCGRCGSAAITRASRSTVIKEMLYICRLLRLQGFRLEKPKISGRGRQSPNRPFSNAELQRFFAHCPSEWKPLFLTLLCTGARPAELVPSSQSTHVPLLKSEVDPEANTVLLRGAKRHAGSPIRKRLMPVPPSLVRVLADQMENDDRRTVFAPMAVGDLAKVFDQILRAAEIEKVNALGEKMTSHSFRHTYATMLHKAVLGDLAVLQRALGHTQISTTMIYDHYEGEAVVIDIQPYLGDPSEEGLQKIG